MRERLVLSHGHRFTAGGLALLAFFAWAWGGLELTRDFGLFSWQSRNSGGYVEFIAWLAGFALLLGALLWITLGKKTLYIREGTLTIAASIFGFTFYRTEPLVISEARNLRIEEYQFAYRGKRVTRFRLSAECQGKQRNLLSDLSETQARTVAEWGPLLKLQKTTAAD